MTTEEGWKRYPGMLRTVEMSVNGRRIIPKKWLILNVVHEVVKPDRSFNRIGCWIDLGHGNDECDKVEYGISKCSSDSE